MSLQFMDGFDHYNTLANLQKKWDASSGYDGSTVLFQPGRTLPDGTLAGQSLKISGHLVYLNSGIITTIVVGFAVNLASYSGSTFDLLRFKSTDNAQTQVTIKMDAAGHVQAFQGASNSLGASSTNALPLNAWHYIEVAVYLSNGQGSVEFRVDGSNAGWLYLINLVTWSSGSTGMGRTELGGLSSMQIDDVYVDNSSTLTFRGNSKIMALAPNTDYTAQWSATPAGSHYVNVTSADDDGSYVSSSVGSQQDAYIFPSVAYSGPIKAVQFVIDTRVDSGTTRGYQIVYRDTSGNWHSLTGNYPPTTYVMYTSVYESDPKDPTGNTPWTPASLANPALFGFNCV